MTIFEKISEKIKKSPENFQPYEDYFYMSLEEKERDLRSGVKRLKELSGLIMSTIPLSNDEDFLLNIFDLHKRVLLAAAKEDFDSYLLYIEWDREPGKKFYPPRRKQLLPLVEALQKLEDDELDLLAISMPPGVGKALANDTPVLTKDGWKCHGDLKVGDHVIGMNGEFKKVIAVHPKCQLDVLITFSNGEQIQCHENHEWMIYDRTRNREYVAETKVFENRTLETGTPGKRGHRYVLQIPRAEYVKGEHKDLFDPYTLGVWLGDGVNKNPTICNAKKDKAIIERIIAKGFEPRWSTEHKTTGVMYYGFDFRKELQKYGMCYSKHTTEKHIPVEYLTASVEQRLELLAGLIDTDGCLIGEKYQFTTVEESLRDSFLDLLSTFGWRACVTVKEPKVSTSGIIARRCTYTIGFTPDTPIPCVLTRKCNKGNRTQRKYAITSIKRVEAKEGNCITVEGDGMYLAGRKMIPTHNTSLAIFYLSWVGGKHPDKPMLGGSHSNSFLRGVYDEVNRVLDPEGEYLWRDVFKDVPLADTNAKDMRIDLGKPKRFQTFEFSSVGSGNAGKVRAETLLYCDDLVDGIETALSKDRMDKLWQQYTTDLRQRKIGKCKELHIATRWSLYDVIGRLESQYGESDRAEFIVCPALNENDESNFDYPCDAGFTTEFYHEQREIMDDPSWRALYMNQPIEREGQLYAPDEMRYYFELPTSEPDAIVAVCDTKDRGDDFCVMPIAYQYGEDYYIDAVVCDNSKPEIVETKLVMALLEHKVQLARFESNSAGGRVAEKVQAAIKEKGGTTHITTKYTTANKETKIIVNSPFVKEHFLFRDNSVFQDKDYRRMMTQLFGYTLSGKNKHDDTPDAIAQLSEYVQSMSAGKVEIFRRPW